MLSVARATSTSPSILLLDEPAAGMDRESAEKIGNKIQHMAKALGIVVLLIEHDIELVMNISDNIVVLNNGQKLAEGTPDAIKQNHAVVNAYLGDHDANHVNPLETSTTNPSTAPKTRLLSTAGLCVGYQLNTCLLYTSDAADE